jgi:putative lipoic acid-binding regulatory protein
MQTGSVSRHSETHGMQHCENMRKSSLGNYESPALTAELQARDELPINHAKLGMTNAETVRLGLAFPVRALSHYR